MHWKRTVGLCFTFFILILSACSKENSSPKVSPTVEVRNPQSEKTPTVFIPKTTKTITWVLPVWDAPTLESQNEINRLLEQKGVDCTIEFVSTSYPVDVENEQWLEEYEKENVAPDVLDSGTWYCFVSAYGYVKKNFLCLNEYLQSEDGRKLREAFSDAEWRSASINGEIFVLPGVSGTQDLARGVYLSVRTEYESLFRECDGTYNSLKSICETVGDGRIGVDGCSYEIAAALLGYQLYGTLPYDPEARQVKNLSEDNRLIALLDEMFSDLKTGKLVDLTLSNSSEDGLIAYVHQGLHSRKDGWAQICVSRDPESPQVMIKYGVCIDSSQKELTLQVLSECVSDPQIYALLHPSLGSAEIVTERRKILDQEEAGDLVGFMPELSDEQIRVYREYTGLLHALTSPMRVSVGETVSLVDHFDSSAVCESLVKEKYRELTDIINRQIAEYHEKQERTLKKQNQE